MDLYEIISTLAILISIASSSAGLGYWLAKQLGEIRGRFEGIDEEFEGIERRFEGIDEEFKKIDERFKKIDEKFERIDERFERIEKRIGDLERGFYGFNELLLRVLEARNVITKVDAVTLAVALNSLIPRSSTKYYTKEVEERLRQLLNKDLESYTMDDIR